MSEPILKVLTNNLMGLPESAKAIGRQNIDAQQSITYSYSGGTITAIDGSAVGQSDAITEIVHDANLSGSGTSAFPLGLASEITLSASGLPYTATVTPYSVQMCQTGSATSYFGLNYFWLRDSAGGESDFYTNKLEISDAGQCTLSAMPTAVEFFNGNELNRFASYNLSGTVLSASGVSPTTAKLCDNMLSFYESGQPSANYDRTGLQVGTTADVQTTLSKNLKFEFDVGGNLESTTYMANGFSGTTYTPTGNNRDTGIVTIHGLTGVNSFGDYKIWDGWNSAKRAQIAANGDEESVIDMYIGYNNGAVELYPAYIGFYNPFDGSAFIYQSSIVAWNNNLSAVSAGYGLSGNGTSGSPLCVTGFKTEYTSPYASSCISSDRTSIDILTDEYSARMHDDGFWVTYGGSVFHSSTVQMRADNLSINDYTTDDNTYLNASSVRLYYHLNDSTASASAEINANVLTSLFAWAVNNGWTPPA